MDTKVIEQNKIKQVARDYEKRGYRVIVEPKGKDIPSFIHNYLPDIIASNDSENVVIEITTRSDMAAIEKLKDVADLINERKGWRFELVVTTSRQEVESIRKPQLEFIKTTDLSRVLSEVKTLTKLKFFREAFILSWSCLESLSRQLLLDDNKNLKNKNPLTLIKTLFSFGYISHKELDLLEKLFDIRNKVVHGYLASDLNKSTIEKLTDIIEQIVKEN
ncbi:MAG: hypothetical protein BGO55_24010 [Sphingobacteriales bacterium 50-39]|nr:hypothetical protein [Sphingobacteriales bacterium]OJW58365.1 MAG: hypothetical protein BGO55_24010 [Sphingobacteriales bacterium 50-39]